MLSFRKKQSGVTLLETILVLVIAMFIIYMGMQQYLVYRQAADVQTVQYNVNLLFQALSQYFQANCKSMSPVTPFPVPMNQLSGYLSGPLQMSNIADTSGYVVQFNYANPTSRTINMSVGSSPRTVGEILVWQAQVSVKLNDTANAQAYANLLGANCLSSGAYNYVNPCGSGGTDYAVFTQLPSYTSSTYWPTMPVVSQFTQMYNTYPFLYLADMPGASNIQLFVCGSSRPWGSYP